MKRTTRYLEGRQMKLSITLSALLIAWVRGRKYGTGQCRSLLPIRFVSCRVHRKARRGAAAAAGRASRGDPRRRRRRCWSAAWNTDESWRSRQSSRQALTAPK